MHPLSRAIKKDISLRLGLFAFPVTVHSSVVEDVESSLRTVCTGAGRKAGVIEQAKGAGKTASAAMLAKAEHPISTVKQSLVCPVCESTHEFAKAKDVGTGLIEIPREVMEAADAAEKAYSSTLILQPYLAAEVSASMIPSGKSYYLSVSANANYYATLVETITARPDLAFLTQWAIRSAVSPFQLVVENGDLLVLRQLADPALVRARPVITGAADAKELGQALKLTDALVAPFDPAAFDRPKSRMLAAFVEGKAPQVSLVEATAGGPAPGLSLLDALTAALAAKTPKVTRRKSVKKVLVSK